jgi:hypothetical protein
MIWRRLLVSLLAVVPATAGASDKDPPGEEQAAQATIPLTLRPAKPVELECATKSVVVATNAANATSGQLRLSLLLKDADAKPAKGAWRVVRVEAEHTGSLGHREAKTCADSCPLTVAVDGHIELWSPAPKGIDQLADNELLLLAVVKSDSLDLRATTFSGKQIESLEEGHCRVQP